MNARQAIAKLRQLTGQHVGYYESPGALDTEQRAVAHVKTTAARRMERDAKARLDELRVELLKDPAYVALRNEWSTLRDEANALSSSAYRCRLTVGRNSGGFFHVLFEGDNWEDVVAKALAKKRSEQE